MRYFRLATAVLIAHTVAGAATPARGPWSAECQAEHDKYQLQYYQQTRYQLVDAMGDLALEKLALGNERALEAPSSSATDDEAFLQTLAPILRQERHENHLRPSVGAPHAWSREYRKCYPLSAPTSKVSLALALGVTARYLVSGNEEALVNEMLDQADGSVSPAVLFRQSYRLNRGDVYLTLLTIENILHRLESEPDADRATLKLAQKLAPETQDFFARRLYDYVRNEHSGRDLRALIRSQGEEK